MSNTDIVAKLKELQKLCDEKKTLENNLNSLCDDGTIATDVIIKLSQSIGDLNTSLVFPKLIVDEIDDNNENDNDDKEFFISLNDDLIDKNKDRLDQCLNDAIYKHTFPSIKNINISISDDFSTDDIDLIKNDLLETFLELEKNSLNLKNEFATLKKKLTNETIAEYENKKIDIMTEIDKINEMISSIDVVHEKYIHLVPKMIEILEERRAESLTDALNLAIQDEKQDIYVAEQLKIEKEKLYELQRKNAILKEEVAERNEILERDLYEQRIIQEEHNQQMQELAEKQAEFAEEQMRYSERQARAAEAQSREIERANKEAERNEKERQRKLNYAASKYQNAAQTYRIQKREDAKRDMDYWYGEMQKYK